MSRAQNLCRLCEFPSGDSGVSVDALDADKLAKWWKQNLGTTYLTDAEGVHHLVICQFCLWEARIVHEYRSLDDCSVSTDACDWWSGHDNDHFYQEYFYNKPLIQPCKVDLEKISSETGQELLGTTSALLNAHQICSQDKLELQNRRGCTEQVEIDCNSKVAKKIYLCTLCNKIYRSLGKHIKKNHKNALRCKSKHCTTYFLTDIERRQHEEKTHFSEGSHRKCLKCIFCGNLTLGGVGKMNRHIQQKHKEAIKCDFYNLNRCSSYFHTEVEKSKHILEVHNKIDLDPKQCIYCGKTFKFEFYLTAHVRNIHADIGIKCRFRGCLEYFFDQNESDEHFLKEHKDAQSLKKFQCPKCSFRTKTRNHFRNHLLTLHAKREATLKCPLCPKAFFVEKILKVHLNACHGERCTCEHCGKTLRKISLQRHFLSKHAG